MAASGDGCPCCLMTWWDRKQPERRPIALAALASRALQREQAVPGRAPPFGRSVRMCEKQPWVAGTTCQILFPRLLLCGRSRGGKARFLVAVIKLCECACAARVSLFGDRDPAERSHGATWPSSASHVLLSSWQDYEAPLSVGERSGQLRPYVRPVARH
jgi:hypothetical protein